MRVLFVFVVLIGLRQTILSPKLPAERWHRESIVVVRVIDGDTFDADDGRRIRLLGIDAPELPHDDEPDKRGAVEACDWLTRRISGRKVLLRFDTLGRDRRDRTLAWVYLPSGNLVNLECLAAGHARLVTRFGLPADLVQELHQAAAGARVRRLGIWSAGRTQTD